MFSLVLFSLAQHIVILFHFLMYMYVKKTNDYQQSGNQ